MSRKDRSYSRRFVRRACKCSIILIAVYFWGDEHEFDLLAETARGLAHQYSGILAAFEECYPAALTEMHQALEHFAEGMEGNAYTLSCLSLIDQIERLNVELATSSHRELE
jgi:hypothetical protein